MSYQFDLNNKQKQSNHGDWNFQNGLLTDKFKLHFLLFQENKFCLFSILISKTKLYTMFYERVHLGVVSFSAPSLTVKMIL